MIVRLFLYFFFFWTKGTLYYFLWFLAAWGWARSLSSPRTGQGSVALPVVVHGYVPHQAQKLRKLDLLILILILFLKDMGQVIFAPSLTGLDEVREILLQQHPQARLVNHVIRFAVFVEQVDHAHHVLLRVSVAHLGFQGSRAEKVSLRRRMSVVISFFKCMAVG